ncbi:MAG: hypothetical protein H7Y89_03865 [Steroidobacteraceae bacterium]|nr:hypothetical protein [Steroidobacteraceae bacterium]
MRATPVLCIDGFSIDPGHLVDLATTATFIDPGSVYPGVRAPAPAGYVESMLAAVAPDIEAAYGATPDRDLELCAYSMVTTAPGKLRAVQRIPHFDGPDVARIAFLHYLCAPSQGGTSFYRHRATGFEVVAPDQVEDYRKLVVAEMRSGVSAPDYVGADTRHFEKIHTVDAAFNRLIVYKGNALHSGDIGLGTVLSEDPRLGRLTINGFGFLRCQFAGRGPVDSRHTIR